MDNELLEKLLSVDDLFDFTMIIWVNKIPKEVWQNNKQVFNHYKYLKSQTVPLTEVPENTQFLRRSMKRAKENHDKKKEI